MAWIAAATHQDFGDRDVIGVDCGGLRVALYRLGSDVLATSERCPHQGAPLSAGCLVDGFIECPVHFALFDVRTGVSDGAMTARKVQTFPTRVAGDTIYVDVPAAEENDR